MCINVAAFTDGRLAVDNFITFSLTITATLMFFDNLAQLLAVAFVNPVLGMLAFLGVWSSSIIFCGLVFRGEGVVWPGSSTTSLPLKWTFRIRRPTCSCPARSPAPKRASPAPPSSTPTASLRRARPSGFTATA